MNDLSLLTVIIIWALNYSIIKAALSLFAPLAFNSLRFILASVILFWVMKRSERKFPSTWREWIPIAVVGFLGNFIYQIFFIFGLHLTLAGNTTLILASTPVFISLFAHMAGYERVTPRMWLGIGISFTGIALITLGSHGEQGNRSEMLRGDLLELAASVIWSAYIVASTPIVKRHGPVMTVATTLWTGTAFLVLASIPSLASQNWSALRWYDWGAVLFSGGVTIALGQILWYRGISKLGNARTSAYSNLTPLFGLLVAWPLLGETPQLVQGVGAAAILSGVILTRMKSSAPAAE